MARLTLTVNNPDSGSATEEIEVDYDAAPIDIGFNARYLLDITAQLDGDTALFKLADPGSPTIDPGPRGRVGALRADADAGLAPIIAHSFRRPCVERRRGARFRT